MISVSIPSNLALIIAQRSIKEQNKTISVSSTPSKHPKNTGKLREDKFILNSF